MKVRVISGTYGGRIIDGSGTERTHPMGERIRNAMFNIVGDEIKGARVLDAFSGSGAVGIEAVSRGASTSLLIERDRIAQKIIVSNIELLGASNQVSLVKTTVGNWLSTYTGEQFDVIFADPPYDDLQLSTVFELTRLLKPNGLMVLSYVGRGDVPTANGVVVVDNRSYGTAALAFYRKKDA